MLGTLPFPLHQKFGMHGDYAFFFHALAVNIAQVKGLIVCFVFQKVDFQSSQLTTSSEKFQLRKLESWFGIQYGSPLYERGIIAAFPGFVSITTATLCNICTGKHVVKLLSHANYDGFS